MKEEAKHLIPRWVALWPIGLGFFLLIWEVADHDTIPFWWRVLMVSVGFSATLYGGVRWTQLE